jgi:Mn-dependent DtxR family transcriptional regulator
MNAHRNKILEFLRKEKVATSSDVARFLKVSWNTAESHLKELLIENKVERIKKRGANLWTKK